MITYKGIVHNIIEKEIDNFVYKKANTFPTIKEITVKKYDSETLVFDIIATVNWNDYEIGGCVTEFGNVFIGTVQYDGMKCTEKDANGEWILESAKPYHKLIYGDELKTFDFKHRG